jgi:hypothetical protein
MELLVATWTLRLALVGAVAVAAVSLSAGAGLIDAVDRAVLAAFALTFLGRQLIGWLETPEQRMLRLRARREAAVKRGQPGGKPKREPQARKQKPDKKARPEASAALAADGPASTSA